MATTEEEDLRNNKAWEVQAHTASRTSCHHVKRRKDSSLRSRPSLVVAGQDHHSSMEEEATVGLEADMADILNKATVSSQ